MNQEINQFNGELKKKMKSFLLILVLLLIVAVAIFFLISKGGKKEEKKEENKNKEESSEVHYQCDQEKIHYDGPFNDTSIIYDLIKSYYFKYNQKEIIYGSLTYTFYFANETDFATYKMSSSMEPVSTNFDQESLTKVYTYGISIPAEAGTKDVAAYLVQLKKEGYTCTKEE